MGADVEEAAESVLSPQGELVGSAVRLRPALQPLAQWLDGEEPARGMDMR
jgi:hypothetical protein